MVKAVTVCNYMQAVSMRERERKCVLYLLFPTHSHSPYNIVAKKGV